MSSFYLYVLSCSDNTLYTGITTNIERRVDEHNTSKKGAQYTKTRRPVRLVFSKRFKSRSKASQEEYRFKQYSREQKLELIGSVQKNKG